MTGIVGAIFLDEDKEHEDNDLPHYSDKGNIVFKVLTIFSMEDRKAYSWSEPFELEILYYDYDSSCMWLNEGIGIDYWINHEVDFPDGVVEGEVFVIEGVNGTYFKGTWSFDDDDEEWEYDTLRLATPEEILEYPSQYGPRDEKEENP